MELIKDKFSTSRGSHSGLLEISCRVCEKRILLYQKDGPGNLRRLYLDRIRSPSRLAGLKNKALGSVGPLVCSGCKEMLGTPYIYLKEKRKTFKMYQDAVVKKIVPIATADRIRFSI
jgi:hypothetical protein